MVHDYGSGMLMISHDAHDALGLACDGSAYKWLWPMAGIALRSIGAGMGAPVESCWI